MAEESEVTCAKGLLQVHLIHQSDPDTSILITVDRYEAYFTLAGIGCSMLLQFPECGEDELMLKTCAFLISSLQGKYHKIEFRYENNEPHRVDLVWKASVFLKQSHINFMPIISGLWTGKQLEQQAYYYSSFLD